MVKSREKEDFTMTTFGYSYTRFSTPDQAKGHSKERQDSAAQQFCLRHNITLDSSRNLHDAGVSAFSGDHHKNADRYALASFLKMVETGQIKKALS